MKHTTEWATIGKIVAPFGIRGELKVYSLTDIPDRFVMLKEIYLGPDHTPRQVVGVRPHKGDVVLLKLKGVNDINMAETLRNQELCIPLEDLATLPPDAYYQHDIVGLQVRTLQDQPVGTIAEIMPTGANDVYVVQSPSGKQILLPAIKEVIKQIDLMRQVMYIHPMEGLLDDDTLVIDPTEKEEE